MINYYANFQTKIGEITVICNDSFLLRLYLEGQIGEKISFHTFIKDENHPIIKKVFEWICLYLDGKNPSNLHIPICLNGTKFQKDVWEILLTIPYGKVTTYSDIAHLLEKRYGIQKMSSQAVGNAVKKNPISLLIPCHRVVGKSGYLVGYAGGIDKKSYLLKLEGIRFIKEDYIDIKESFFVI